MAPGLPLVDVTDSNGPMEIHRGSSNLTGEPRILLDQTCRLLED